MLKYVIQAFCSGLVLIGSTNVSMAAQSLQLDVYNPGEQAIFAVSSVLITGATDAILVDAQFAKPQAEELVEKIRKSGKTLTMIYISHGDPDYYFGLQTITDAYPNAKVVATAPTVSHIQKTKDGKLAYWGPKLGNGAPDKIVVPQIMRGSTLNLEGQQLQIKGLDGPQPERTFVWIPSIKAVVGGVVLTNNAHVWMADTQTPKSHRDWLATLANIENLHPKTVVPGHFLSGDLKPLQSVRFTADYIKVFDREAVRAKNSAALITAMTGHFPKLGDTPSLELSAQVAKGEVPW